MTSAVTFVEVAKYLQNLIRELTNVRMGSRTSPRESFLCLFSDCARDETQFVFIFKKAVNILIIKQRIAKPM
jgi:hypothetical protein